MPICVSLAPRWWHPSGAFVYMLRKSSPGEYQFRMFVRSLSLLEELRGRDCAVVRVARPTLLRQLLPLLLRRQLHLPLLADERTSQPPDARHPAAAIVVPVFHLAPRPALRFQQPQTRAPRAIGQSALLLQQPQTGAPGDEGAATRGRRGLRATLRGAGCSACGITKGTGRADRVLTLTPKP